MELTFRVLNRLRVKFFD